MPGLDTTLFYVPRRGVTEAADRQRTHQAFWRAYFGDTVTFEEQPKMRGYPSEPLMGQPTELEVATRERERLELERARAERLRRQLERENEALAEARERAAAERRELEARQTYGRLVRAVAVGSGAVHHEACPYHPFRLTSRWNRTSR